MKTFFALAALAALPVLAQTPPPAAKPVSPREAALKAGGAANTMNQFAAA